VDEGDYTYLGFCTIHTTYQWSTRIALQRGKLPFTAPHARELDVPHNGETEVHGFITPIYIALQGRELSPIMVLTHVEPRPSAPRTSALATQPQRLSELLRSEGILTWQADVPLPPAHTRPVIGNPQKLSQLSSVRRGNVTPCILGFIPKPTSDRIPQLFKDKMY